MVGLIDKPRNRLERYSRHLNNLHLCLCQQSAHHCQFPCGELNGGECIPGDMHKFYSSVVMVVVDTYDRK